MKILTYMLAPVMVCLFTSDSALADAFTDFRAEVQRKVPAGWVCGEVRTIEGRMLFDVSSPKNRFAAVITQHDLISQQEWNSRAQRMKQSIDALIAGKELDEVDSLMNGMSLPDGRFGATAVAVGLSEPEIFYPESRADGLESKAVIRAILGILNLYDKFDQAKVDQPATRSESKPEGSQTPQPESEGRTQ